MRITKISVRSLFGIFNYDIPLNPDERVTIIHGPNGCGKTTLLTMLHSLLSGRYSELRRIPFADFRVELDGGRSELWAIGSLHPPREARGQGTNGPKLAIHFRPEGKQEEHFAVDQIKNRDDLAVPLSFIEHEIPQIARVGSDTWQNMSTGEELSLEEVLDRFPESFPPSVRQTRRTPQWARELSDKLSVRFIKAQRLLSTRQVRRDPGYRDAQPMTLTVSTYSKELAQAIQSKLAESAALSQSLDRTFPARVVRPDEPTQMTSEQLRELLAQLEQKRSHLMEAGLLDTAKDMDFQVPEEIDDRARSILSVYVNDVEKKLSIFDDMVSKIDLLRKILTERFLYKQVTINKDKGFEFITSNRRPLAPDALSSGEQHELVLLYELLFKVEPGSVILIDEPELSLHIAWQEAFLPDLLEIARLGAFDVMLATHSPQIINDRWDLAVELKGPDR